MNSKHSPSEAVRAAALRAGACAAGIAAVADLGEPSRELYAEWIAEGRHGSMAYLEKYTELRPNPATLLPGARSILSTAWSYRLPPGTRRHPLFADYALGEDYHEVLRRRLAPVCELITQLFPGASTRVCVDTAPLHERFWAVRAGLGFIGRNSMLTVPAHGAGSRVFLAEILTDAPLEPDRPEVCSPHPCADCDRCVRACPGQAIRPDGSPLDARRCYSYNTIENRDETLPDGIRLRERRVYGCDICQDACPWNSGPYTGPYIEKFAPRPALYSLTSPEDLTQLTPENYRTLFRGSAIRRAKLAQLHRNAKNALGE